MASNSTKEGLHYIQVDIDIYDDHKVILAQELIDPDGTQPWLRYACGQMPIRLLVEVFRKSYYMEWNDAVALTTSRRMDSVITMSVLNKIVDCLLRSGFFNLELFHKYGVLTSHGIQKRWVWVSKNAKRKNINIRPELNLLPKVIHIPKNEIPEFSGNTPEVSPKTPEYLPKLLDYKNYIIITLSKGIGNKGYSVLINNKNTNNNSSLLKTPEVLAKTPEESGITLEEFTKKVKEYIKHQEEIKKTPEVSPKTPEVFEKDQKFYDGHWLVQMPTEFCLNFLMEHKDFKNDRIKCHEKIWSYVQELPEEEHWERIRSWGKLFNNLNDGKFPERTMRGLDSWVQHFYNWFSKQNLSENPAQRINNQRNKKTLVKSNLVSGNDPIEDQEAHYRKKK